MTAPSGSVVAAADWRAEVAAARAEGYTFFEWLGCVDEIGRPGEPVLRVVVVLRDLDRPAEEPWRVSTELAREAPQLPSLGDLFAGALWHEREVAEMFGVAFEGGDPRRLLLAPGFEGVPMLKDEVLAARTGQVWPGAKEPGESGPGASGRGAQAPSRRRMVPPGVPEPAVWGDRDPEAEPVGAAEVAESAQGGRVRRRRS